MALSPFLNMGVMFAVNQSSSKLPEFNDWVNTTVKIGAISSQQYLSIRAGILSGPHDLEVSRVESSFFTPSTEIVTLLSGGVGVPQHSGIKDESSLVNTDLNCLLRILALPSEWCTNESSIFLFHGYLCD